MSSNNLWVGNLASDVNEADLENLFGKYGEIDSITSYASRSYAFLYFKRLEDAVAAKNALQGTFVHGNSLKIEFAKPAKPCKSLWVSGINSSVSKEKLEEEFLKFGEIEDFKFLRDRNAAFVDYFKLEDASQALKSMNGKRISGDQIRVDFLRSQPSKREQWPDFRDAREGQFLSRNMGPPDSLWMPLDLITNYIEPTHSGSKRQQHSQSWGERKGDGQPSNVLWIRYPPSVHIDEQMLHNAMILFGEIESIKSFPSRNYSFVEFRSVDEARRAKVGLQGRLFNDPRILIMYSSSELVPSKDQLGFYPGIKGPRPDMLVNDLPFRPAQVDLFGHNRPIVLNNIPGSLPHGGVLGSNMPIRPLGPLVGFDPLLSGPKFNDLTGINKLPDNNPNNQMVGPSWRRLSPSGPGILPSPTPAIRSLPGAWDVLDANQIQREIKRSRLDGPLPSYDFPSEKVDDRGYGMDHLYGFGPEVAQGKNRSAVEARFTAVGTGHALPDHDYVWHGIIAKGGTPVCHTRCVPIGKGIESEIPDVINCTARTGLDMLTKHYADAVGFNVVFFLPDSEDDFASYTEFLRYLGSKNRAGVAKFDDGTTLFLVPPSDFLTKVLNVTGPERLYGVVLKFPQHTPSSTSLQSQSHLHSSESQYINRQRVPSQTEYSLIPQEGRVSETNFNRDLHNNPMTPPKQLVPQTSDSLPVQPVTSINTVKLSQSGVTLTPELIATLASLLPAKEKSSGLESTQPPLVSSSSLRPSLPPNVALDNVVPSQGYDRQSHEQTNHSFQQLGTTYNPQEQLLPQLQTYPSASNTPSHYAQGSASSSQIEDFSSRVQTNFAYSSQYQYENSQNVQKSYGMENGTDGFGQYGSSANQQPANPVTLATQFHNATQKVTSEIPNQVQQIQSTLYGAAGLGTSDVEVDKNQRYQSTLQFAANLLLQIQQQQQQQQQQQTSTQATGGHGNH